MPVTNMTAMGVVINNTGRTDAEWGRDRVGSVEPTVDKILQSGESPEDRER